uniref:Saccharopine dehydrogenase NADP binding domain-containing protein n=1 Tax=Auxenochlorella protothecoides TaxID=3075 RepID=A0A1D2A6X0_AUXPR
MTAGSPMASKHVLILGGTGRVGSSTAASLLRTHPDIRISLGSRGMESHGAAVLRRPELRDCPWIGCDARDAHSLDKALSSSGVDLVVHAAGPFQGDAACSPLEAAIRHGVPYMDVCDDATYAQRAKRLEPAARAAGVPALSTAGIFPGLSNVMAADMVTRHAGGRAPARVLYSYYTAGTGGAGPTILETTFLLAGQDVVVYRDGKQLTVPAISNRRPVDFGTTIGTKSVYLYNLPETHTGRAVFQAPSISARFGIDPGVFNVAMILVARLLPKRREGGGVMGRVAQHWHLLPYDDQRSRQATMVL